MNLFGPFMAFSIILFEISELGYYTVFTYYWMDINSVYLYIY